MWPSSRSAVRTASPTESSSATSHVRPTEPSSCDATASARSRSRSTTATRPPSAANRRVVAAPRPEAPPVAKSTLPPKRCSVVLVALVVLERDVQAHAVARDLPVLNRHVEACCLGDAEIADRLARCADGVLRRSLPRIRTGADHLGHAVDAVAHCLAPLGSIASWPRTLGNARPLQPSISQRAEC